MQEAAHCWAQGPQGQPGGPWIRLHLKSPMLEVIPGVTLKFLKLSYLFFFTTLSYLLPHSYPIAITINLGVNLLHHQQVLSCPHCTSLGMLDKESLALNANSSGSRISEMMPREELVADGGSRSSETM
jgi:hypothetical protein